ncbi:MAG: cysteine desulfurase [Bacilli bacterium]|nr:cysteine desulfurase [Bacilli bacterium]
MIYLDYSATTPVDKRVLDTFNKVSLEYPGNSNSLHSLGVKSKELEDYLTEQIAKMLKVKKNEIIYTSGASESNNLAIKGICNKYKNRGKHIITTFLEHSSIIAPLNYLSNQGFEVDFVKIDDNGQVDLEDLKNLMRDDTILVSISMVDSEIGLKQPIQEIAKIVKNYPKCFFHVDCTQAFGKVPVDLTSVDLASMSAHKIYGLKGIGMLIKKENIVIEPLIHGGKSTTSYRSGTPALPLIASLYKALDLIIPNVEKNYEYIQKLNKKIVDKLKEYENVHINSTVNSIPNTINFSIKNIKPETFIHALDEKEIYISTKSACSSSDSISNAVYALTKDRDISNNSLRISLSYLTTEEEIETFIKVFDDYYNKLQMKVTE